MMQEIDKIDVPGLQSFLSDFRRLAPAPSSSAEAVTDTAGLTSFLRAYRARIATARDQGLALNPWTVAGLGRNEVRNCAVLATLVDSGRLGITARNFLTVLLDRVPGWGRHDLLMNDVAAGNYVVKCETCIAGDWSNRVDVLIESDAIENGWMIAIEVKIDAGLGRRQLEDYHDDLHRRALATGRSPFLLFLAPFEPVHLDQGVRRDLGHLRWDDVHDAANKAIEACGDGHAHARYMLAAFRDHIAHFG